jgi:ABC-type lipoprotein release transport system permease subunit
VRHNLDVAILVRARADIRRRWRSWLGLALLVAIAGGGVLTLAAGARRTNSAYPRFLRAKRAADVFLFLTDRSLPPVVQRFPQVAESASAVALEPAVTDFAPVVLTDSRLGRELNRFKFVAGRPLRPDRADEAVVSFLVAKSRHLRVGSQLTIPFLVGEAAPRAVTFRVVGIEAAPAEFPPRSAIYNLPVYLSPAFLRTPVGSVAVQNQASATQLAVRLRHGARDVPGFLASVERLSGAGIGQTVLADQTVNTQRSLHLQAIALWLMAGFVGLASTLILVQLLLRQSVEDADDHVTLRALGMTPGQLYLSGLVGIAAIGLVGAAGALSFAAILSPLLPLGTARIAEPHPGFAFDGAALGIGVVGIVALVGLLGAAVQLRTTIRTRQFPADEPRSERPSSLGNILTRPRLPLVATIGIRLAVQPGKGRTAVPVRATLVAAVIGIGSMAAAVTFGASLTHLLATPPLYGATFDADIKPNGNNGDARTLLPVLRDRPAVTAMAVALTGIPMQSGRVSFGAFAQTTVKGSLEPTVIDGRLPTGPDEILLGSRTLHDLHAHVGQTIQVSVTGLTGGRPLQVVGRGVLAAVQDNEQLGQGGVITPDGLAAFVASAPPGFSPPPPGDVFVRIRPGPGQQQAIDALSDPLGGPGKVSIYRPIQPGDVANFGQVGNLPQILAGLLGLIAVTTMAHLLVSAVRRRRRDLAVLKTLGFVPGQVSAAIACQATVVALLAAVVGLPLGLAAGRWGWRLVAGQVGLVVRPIFPWGAVAVLVPSALLIANLVAAGPALVAGRIPPATVLRTE